MSPFLFPLALSVPGPQHLIDNVLQCGMGQLSWWASWEPELKSVTQWINPVGNRRAAQFILRREGGPGKRRRRGAAGQDDGPFCVVAVEDFAQRREVCGKAWASAAEVGQCGQFGGAD